MKALLEIYLRTSCRSRVGPSTLFNYTRIHECQVISKPLCDRYTFSKEYSHSKSTGLKCPKPAYYGVLGTLPLCRTPSLHFWLLYHHQKRYDIAGNITFLILPLVTTSPATRMVGIFPNFPETPQEKHSKQSSHETASSCFDATKRLVPSP